MNDAIVVRRLAMTLGVLVCVMVTLIVVAAVLG